MKFRFKALGLHILASTCALSLILGSLYLGWYRWPGWYLTDVTHVCLVMVGVDIVVGPLLTFTIAAKNKPRRELVRDVSIIVAVQLVALVYGGVSLWSGRPLYYAYSEGFLQLVQAYDIPPEEVSLGRTRNPQFAPHWYSTPRWIWAPLPKDDSQKREEIVRSAVLGGDDVISMPQYFKPWESGLAELKTHLKKVDDVAYFVGADKKKLKAHMQAAGFATDHANAIPLTGRGMPLLAVFDPATVKLAAILRP